MLGIDRLPFVRPTAYLVSKRGTEESILGGSKQEEEGHRPKSDGTMQDQTSSSHHGRTLCHLYLSTMLISLLWNSKARMNKNDHG